MNRRPLKICGWVVLSLILWHFLPKPKILRSFVSSQVIEARDGEVLRLTLTSDQKYRLFRPLSEFSKSLVEATLAHEDQYFYWHPGVNPVSLASGFRSTFVSHGLRRGGSTISMQLARMVYRVSSKTIVGKLQQIALAIFLEAIYSKNEILEAYLNIAPYGGNIEGAPAAAIIYFGKSVQKLTALESISLAVIPQSPSRRSLVGSAATADSIRHRASKDRLRRLWLENHDGDSTLASIPWPQLRRSHEPPFGAPHFIDDIVSRNYPAEIIRTTIKLSTQGTIERILKGYIERRRGEGITNASIAVVHHPTMEIRALVGSANFFDAKIQGQVNGSKAFRSPGSTLKPFVYALAMDQGLIHPRSLLKDAPVSYAGFDPENNDLQFLGPVTVEDALTRSRNIPAIDMASKLSGEGFYGFLRRAGVQRLKSKEHYGLSLAIGGAETTMENLLEFYGMLGNFGEFRKLRRTNLDPQVSLGAFLTPESSFMTLQILKHNPRPGDTSTSVISSRDRVPVYWKTGTSYSYRDAWTVGLVGPYVLAVWIGNFDNTSNSAFVGRDTAAPLFFQLADALTQENSGQIAKTILDVPPGKVRRVEVCSLSGDLPGPFCQARVKTWYIPKVSPVGQCSMHRQIHVNPITGLRVCNPGGTKDSLARVAEFWPTDLLKILRQNSVGRILPPGYEPGCDLADRDSQGQPPRIKSPRAEVIYEVDIRKDNPDPIGFQADVDSSSRKVFWYLGRTLIGSSAPSEPFYWTPSPGKYLVKAVDDLGRSSERILEVEAI
ncbi:MAG: penicillin-binding protein 1C [Proteobacteria bacterium]|nr:penicillin-binding protein 1C [Pseudomonadota bacterium]